MYLYNTNILEHVQIAQSEPKCMIHNIEGRSKKYAILESIYKLIDLLIEFYNSYKNSQIITVSCRWTKH